MEDSHFTGEMCINIFLMGHEYRNKITVKVFVIRYLDSVIQQIPENLVTTAAAPATEHLPKIFNERKHLICHMIRYITSTTQ